MAVSNPFSITFAGQEVGGSTDYQLHGPYVLDKRHDSLRIVFDVVVVGVSYADTKAKSEKLEDAFSKRAVNGDELVISLDGSKWTYTHGTTMLSAQASVTKSGNPDSDKGFSRAYTCAIEAGLPATADTGLRDIETVVELEASRQKTVTMRGTYTATTAGHAVSRYQADFDAEAATLLTAIDASATWELVQENYTYDREQSGSAPNPHVCNFTRQYLELLEDQSQGLRDDAQIRDHRIVFTDLSQFPGDSKENIHRLRRVVGNYDCAIDIDVTTDLQAVFDNKVKSHVVKLFTTNFTPQVFCIEDRRVSYDETNKRLSVALQFLYQAEDSEAIVEVSQSVAYREVRNIDYTPVHGRDELAFAVDVGWAVVERVWSRTAVVVGDEHPKNRIASAPKAGDAGLFKDKIGGIAGPDSGGRRDLKQQGWNTITNTSNVSQKWMGDPNGDQQMKLSVLTESVVERFSRPPGGRTAVPVS